MKDELRKWINLKLDFCMEHVYIREEIVRFIMNDLKDNPDFLKLLLPMYAMDEEKIKEIFEHIYCSPQVLWSDRVMSLDEYLITYPPIKVRSEYEKT